MGLLDAIDRLLEPITKRIFTTELGKNIRPLTGDELNELSVNHPDYYFLPCNIFHSPDDD
jgi:hypothetical protein